MRYIAWFAFTEGTTLAPVEGPDARTALLNHIRDVRKGDTLFGCDKEWIETEPGVWEAEGGSDTSLFEIPRGMKALGKAIALQFEEGEWPFDDMVGPCFRLKHDDLGALFKGVGV